MGNFTGKDKISGSSAPDQESLYITHQEKLSIHALYSRLLVAEPHKDPDLSSPVFDIAKIKSEFKHGLIENVMMFWLAGNVKTVADFETFIIECTRVSASKILELHWNMIRHYLESTNPSGKTLLRTFYLLLIDASEFDASSSVPLKQQSFSF